MSKREPGDKLTPAFVKTIKKPGTYGDGRTGHGLSLKVKERAKGGVRKYWNQRIRINGKRRDRGLGSVPVVSLEKAREKAFENARRVHQGEDITKPPPTVPTVKEDYEAMIKDRENGWSPDTKKKWCRAMLRCKPIWDTPVSEVTEYDVTRLLNPLWLTSVTNVPVLAQPVGRDHGPSHQEGTPSFKPRPNEETNDPKARQTAPPCPPQIS